MGDNSIPNVYPVWVGEGIPSSLIRKKTENRFKMEDLSKGKAIWHNMRKEGWISMLGAEFCDIYFADGIGKIPEVDHLISQFW